jgi:hypothetical protein
MRRLLLVTLVVLGLGPIAAAATTRPNPLSVIDVVHASDVGDRIRYRGTRRPGRARSEIAAQVRRRCPIS